MTVNKKEKKIEAYFKEQVALRGGMTRKFTSPGRRGVPDQIMFFPQPLVPQGFVGFVELKTPAGSLSALQRREFQRIHAMNAPLVALRSKEAVDKFMEVIDAAIAQSNELQRMGSEEISAREPGVAEVRRSSGILLPGEPGFNIPK